LACVVVCLSLAAAELSAATWSQFRGPGGQGSTPDAVPVEWSSTKNIVWKATLPGPGASSPCIVGDRVYVTSYTGYGVDAEHVGSMDALQRHLVCVSAADGKIRWRKSFDPRLPEHKYEGEGAYHGYSSSTPVCDGRRLYVFFGKSGVYCFDLDGNELWHASVGDRIHHWGSAASPILYGDLLIVNASVESGSVVALHKLTGQEAWRAGGIQSAWNTPVLIDVPGGRRELVVPIQERMLGIDPDNGRPLWNADGIHRYVCPSAVTHEDVVYAIGGGHTSLAVRAGGRGDVTKTHTLWRKAKGSNVSSPVYFDGHLYWASEKGGLVHCQDARTGELAYSRRLDPPSDLIYASALLAGGRIYYVSQHSGTYVVAAGPKFELLAHNVFEDDSSRANASPAVAGDRLLMRTDQALYCIGNR
jgi:outer membrane protein assembly factor BamB